MRVMSKVSTRSYLFDASGGGVSMGVHEKPKAGILREPASGRSRCNFYGWLYGQDLRDAVW